MTARKCRSRSSEFHETAHEGNKNGKNRQQGLEESVKSISFELSSDTALTLGTPHSTTHKAPAELLFKRKLRTKLPQLFQEPSSALHSEVKQRDKTAKDQMKVYKDLRTHAKPSDTQVGDRFLVLQQIQSKFSSKFDPKPYTVTACKGGGVTAERNETFITRKISHFKFLEPNGDSTRNSDNEDYDFDYDDGRQVQLQNLSKIENNYCL